MLTTGTLTDKLIALPWGDSAGGGPGATGACGGDNAEVGAGGGGVGGVGVEGDEVVTSSWAS